MKDEPNKMRSIRKTWSSTSIAEEVKYMKHSNKRISNFIKTSTKTDFFPIDSLQRHEITKKKLIINPDSSIKVIWDMLLLFFLMIRLYIIPYQLSFSIKMLVREKNVILFTDFAFLVDMILKLNTGFHFKGFLITSRIEIIKHYIKNTFFFDLFGSIPFQVVIEDDILVYSGEVFGIDAFRFILLVKFIHIYRLKIIFYELEDRFTSIHTVTALKFLHFSLLISLLIHWSSCLSHIFYVREFTSVGELWLTFIENESLRYLNYLYYILFTVTSIGYYSLNIVTTDQRLLTIMIMCIDIIIFAYILGKIQSTLDSYQLESNETQRLLKKCKAFISQNKIPGSLRHKVLRYITFCREAERKSSHKENDILKDLSLPLREEIFTQTRGHILSKQAVFKMYQQSFLKFIGYHLRLQIFGPQDGIFEEGENGSTIYFIQNGQIEIYHASTSTTFKTLKKGKCFGEIGFFLETIRTASAKSVSFTELLVLTRPIMNKILSSRPVEKCMTEALITETGRSGLSILHIRCYLCNVLGHVANSCTTYKVSIDIKGILKKIDNSKFKYSKNVNLNDAYKFTFQRSEVTSKRDFSVAAIMGKPMKTKRVYKGRPELVKKCSNFNLRIPNQRVRKKSMASDSDSSSSSDGRSSPLPVNMQYRQAFLRRTSRKNHLAIELFNTDSFPVIFLNKPPEI